MQVSPHRLKRPWLGQVEDAPVDHLPAYDPACYLCPGNERAGGATNPAYEGTFVFGNDYAAILPDTVEAHSTHSLLRVETVPGTARVMCFTPRHDLTLPLMGAADIVAVINTWAEQTADLGRTYRWVQIFENKGQMMGASNPHPHCQIWGIDILPSEVLAEDRQQKQYLEQNERPLLVDYAELEAEDGSRTVEKNDHWLAVVPFWADWPFETMLLPRRPVQRLPELTEDERESLALIMKRLTTRYDNLFSTSFPYTMGWHGAPFDGQTNAHWQLHAHFYPPLLRSATVRKFMVGYEMLGEIQRDLTAEQAAERLRAVGDVHYIEAGL